jgi:hypothetical protein
MLRAMVHSIDPTQSLVRDRRARAHTGERRCHSGGVAGAAVT